MHNDSFKEMARVLDLYLLGERYKIIDVGSQLILGLGLQKTYKDLMKSGWEYVGVDVVEGANVDVVMKNDVLPFAEESVDVVLSGQCLEHCENPFSLVKEMARVTKKGGLVIIAAPWNQGKHLDVDRWRFAPQGFKTLFDHSGLTCIDVYLNQTYSEKGRARHMDCWGIGKK